MIEHKLATVPARKPRHDTGQERQQKAERQDADFFRKAQAPVGSCNCQKGHGSDGMCPACHSYTNAGHEQQFRRSDEGSSQAGNESEASRPDRRTYPEGVSGPPVTEICSKRCDDKSNGKMHAHGMQRVASDGHHRGGRFLLDLLYGRIVRIFGFAHRFNSRPVPYNHSHITLLKQAWRCQSLPCGILNGRVFTGLLAVLGLSGCEGRLSALDPAGPVAASIAELFWIMLWGSAALFALVMMLLALTLAKPGFGRSIPPMRWVLHGGLLMPTIVLALLVSYALFQGEHLIANPPSEAVPRIHVTANQWNWNFFYPQADTPTTSLNVLHIPAGTPVDIVVTSADVIHSFWIPRLGGKIDAIPGRENVIRLQVEDAGTYHGICAEFCGRGHSRMQFHVEAHPPDTYRERISNLPERGVDADEVSR